MKKVFPSIIVLLVLLLFSCGDKEYEDSHVFFSFHNDTHQDPVLASAMNPMSPGVFCIIRYAYVNGRYGSTASTSGLKAGNTWERTTDLSWAMAIWTVPLPSMLTTCSVPTVTSSMCFPSVPAN